MYNNSKNYVMDSLQNAIIILCIRCMHPALIACGHTVREKIGYTLGGKMDACIH